MTQPLEILRRPLLLMLAAALATFALAGCGTDQGSEASDGDGSNAERTQTRTVVDGVGREVTVPAQVDSIVPLGNAPRMVTYLGLADEVVGVGGMDKDQIEPVTAYAYATKDAWGDLPIVGTDAAGATDYYPEQIISVQPDVILCTYTAELADEIQSKTGIPTVAVPQGNLYQEDYEQALRLIGEVCGVEDRAEEVIGYIDDCLSDLDSRTASVSDDEKPTVLGAAATFKGKHGIDGVYVDYPVFTAINARNVTDGTVSAGESIATTVDKEQILGWNPEVIFLDAGNVSLVQEDLKENPDFYDQLAAYESGEFYQYPNSVSYYSNVEIPIVNSYYVASLLYPEQFEDVDFEEKASEVFAFFLDDPDFLSKLEEGGYRYGKVEL